VLVAHWVTYLVGVPAPVTRDAALAASGHGYLSVAGELASAFLALTVVAAFLRPLVGGRGAPVPVRGLAMRLALLQVVAFVAMETVERLVAGAPLAELLTGGLLAVGIVVNLVAALVGAAFLHRIFRLADRVAAVAGAGGSPALRRDRPIGVVAPAAIAPPSARPRSRAWVRGPPEASLA
jgi:hypothetical protein